MIDQGEQFRFSYPLEYVSGGIKARYGDVYVNIANVGNTAESARVSVFREDTPATHTATPVAERDLLALPAHTFTSYEFASDAGNMYWFIIRTTSPELVPSVLFTVQADDARDPLREEGYAWIQPGDFALQHRRVRLVSGEVRQDPTVNQ